jgi:hypothetical protein
MEHPHLLNNIPLTSPSRILNLVLSPKSSIVLLIIYIIFLFEQRDLYVIQNVEALQIPDHE